MKKILSVETMHCEHCAKSVKDAILSVDGIKSVKIDLKKQTAVVSYKEFKEDEVRNAVSNAGFSVTKIEDKRFF